MKEIKSRPSRLSGASRKKVELESHYRSISIPPELQTAMSGRSAVIFTYGCQANVRDGEVLQGILIDIGFTIVDEMEQADLIIFNTCAIRKMAETRVWGQLGRAKTLKEARKGTMIAVCGCMAQDEDNVARIEEKYPYVDIVFGTNNIHQFPELLWESHQKHTNIVAVYSSPEAVNEIETSHRQSTYKAFVNIMQGCDRFCSYCIVPYLRGREISRNPKDIITELKDLRERNFLQVTLVGQNVNAYGKNLTPPYPFAKLLRDVVKVGFARIHFVTSNPFDFSDEMIEVIRNSPSILRHIHLPLQSGANTMLRRMNRAYTIEQYKELYYKLRDIPGMSITTDIIVGFPGETQEEFDQTLAVVKELVFDGAYTFVFSPRQGTPAAKIKDETPLTIKKQRLYQLNEVVEEAARQRNRPLLDQIRHVLVEEVRKGASDWTCSGYDQANKLIKFSSPVELDKGMLVAVKITQTRAWTSSGEVEITKTIELFAQVINNLLLASPIIKDYQTLSKIVKYDPDLTALEEEISHAKRKLVESGMDQKSRDQMMEQKVAKEREYDTNPWVLNYRQAVDRLNELLKQIEKILKPS